MGSIPERAPDVWKLPLGLQDDISAWNPLTLHDIEASPNAESSKLHDDSGLLPVLCKVSCWLSEDMMSICFAVSGAFHAADL